MHAHHFRHSTTLFFILFSFSTRPGYPPCLLLVDPLTHDFRQNGNILRLAGKRVLKGESYFRIPAQIFINSHCPSAQTYKVAVSLKSLSHSSIFWGFSQQILAQSMESHISAKASNRSAQTFLRVVLRSKRARLTGKTCTFDRQNMYS